MIITSNESLAPYTSLNVGGPAEELVLCESFGDAVSVIKDSNHPGVIGYGCNILVSDAGLPGRTVVWRGGEITVNGTEIVADAGVWWDDLAKTALEHKLWGLELMSQIPSSVGGAVFGNIAAYGQQVSDTLSWIEVYNFQDRSIQKYRKDDFEFSYRWSSIQNRHDLAILRVGFSLSKESIHELRYDSALSVTRELNLTPDSLDNRRTIIIETRRRAGSLYDPADNSHEHTAGSFFKNPLVSTEQARQLASFDETGRTLERIENQNRVHGGDSHRASAAHVLLAAGFTRGQNWGRVKLHDQHVLKLQTLEGATAQNVYDVVKNITNTVQSRLSITLELEVKFLGKF